MRTNAVQPKSLEARIKTLEEREERLERTVLVVVYRFADIFGDQVELMKELHEKASDIGEVMRKRIPPKTWDKGFAEWEKVRDEADTEKEAETTRRSA
jgi:hypothetical protein